MANGFFSGGLGRDFWNFRAGQLVSVLGDACGSIALAWWVLDRTGSAAEMGSILAPAMLARIFLLPLCGPIADRYSRRALLVASDLWRFLFSALLFAMAAAGFYRFSLVLACYVLMSVGTALFSASLGGLIPRIVRREELALANQQSQALNSVGSVAGGIIGGVVVSFAGVRGAFAIDAASFLVAAVFTLLIRAETRPERATAGTWREDFLGGFRLIRNIPLLLWLCVVAMFINLSLAPLAVVLPVLVKEARAMPAWFLGGLESSVALGAILGAVSLGWVSGLASGMWVLVGGVAMIGVGTALLPWVPNAVLPLTALFWVGVGSSWANVLLGTQIFLTVPDSYRGRVGAALSFLCSGISPLGVAAAGLALAQLGLNRYLGLTGMAVVALAFLLLFIPRMREFMEVKPEQAEGFFARIYPGRGLD